ncbi:MAG TPA: hypothetical protein VFN88_06330 [Caulobacteraceae bacterium]|nr:hypothetical protein [Caulobacteraceae bacterium]
MKINKTSAAIAVALMGFAGQASAMSNSIAAVSSVQGSVAINQGGVYAPVNASTVLNAGDRIVSMDGSAAQIKYADGCVVSVKASSMATVGATSPCAASGLINTSQPMDFGGFNGFWGAFAIFAVGAILIGAYASSKDDDHNPISP